MKTWPPKDPTEVQYPTINFQPDLTAGETITSVISVIPLQIAGYITDTAIGSMLVGSPILSGALVQQTLVNGIAGNSYQITILCATSLGREIAVGGSFACIPASLQ